MYNLQIEFPATYGTIALLILVFFGNMGNENLTDKLIFSSYQIRKKRQYYRIFSVGLVHAGFIHLGMNLLGLYFFGPIIEDVLGTWITLIIFISSVAGGSFLSLLLRRKEANYQAIGASGGVSGILMAAMLWYPQMRIGLMLLPVMIPAWIFGIIFSLGSIVLTQTADRNRISHEGHLGGMLFGGLVGYWTIPLEILQQSQQVLFYFGVLPIALFALLQWIQPGWFYRK